MEAFVCNVIWASCTSHGKFKHHQHASEIKPPCTLWRVCVCWAAAEVSLRVIKLEGYHRVTSACAHVTAGQPTVCRTSREDRDKTWSHASLAWPWRHSCVCMQQTGLARSSQCQASAHTHTPTHRPRTEERNMADNPPSAVYGCGFHFDEWNDVGATSVLVCQSFSLAETGACMTNPFVCMCVQVWVSSEENECRTGLWF